jgi:hypothetical protein
MGRALVIRISTRIGVGSWNGECGHRVVLQWYGTLVSRATPALCLARFIVAFPLRLSACPPNSLLRSSRSRFRCLTFLRANNAQGEARRAQAKRRGRRPDARMTTVTMAVTPRPCHVMFSLPLPGATTTPIHVLVHPILILRLHCISHAPASAPPLTRRKTMHSHCSTRTHTRHKHFLLPTLIYSGHTTLSHRVCLSLASSLLYLLFFAHHEWFSDLRPSTIHSHAGTSRRCTRTDLISYLQLLPPSHIQHAYHTLPAQLGHFEPQRDAGATFTRRTPLDRRRTRSDSWIDTSSGKTSCSQ